MISFAKEENRKAIIGLWEQAFGDSKATINRFLDNICKDNVIICTMDNKVVGMASVLPVLCNGRKGRYVYAVATDKGYRGQGVCKKIMEYIDDFAQKSGESFLILVPASASLFDFYKKMGYNQQVFAPVVKAEDTGELISPKEYFKIREETLKAFDLISWSENDLRFILSHGKAVKTKNGAVYFENGRAVEVLSPSLNSAKTKPFALIKGIDNFKLRNPYFGLAMS